MEFEHKHRESLYLQIPPSAAVESDEAATMIQLTYDGRMARTSIQFITLRAKSTSDGQLQMRIKNSMVNMMMQVVSMYSMAMLAGLLGGLAIFVSVATISEMVLSTITLRTEVFTTG